MKRTISGVQCGRDATTGKFISVKAAKRRRSTAVVETLQRRRNRAGRFEKARGR